MDKIYSATVENFKSNRSGNPIANQFVITIENGDKIFQSYKSVIAIKTFCGKVQIDVDRWNYSRTTSRYRSQFLNESTKQTQEKISNGTYLLTDLNSCMAKYR
tara:strand:- start:278 stop:586 length:309 start_codon:yes stop_codon:yes gene_type:complete